ncbi:two-component system response regulator [Maribacter algicola]|uniref:Two-component system response regulator n=1 Tax=Meishania litoralis TaxID=3434685 RepID=A0ACC7LMD8_9FLAO
MRKINSICVVDDDPILVFGIKKMLSTVVDCDSIIDYGNGKLALDGILEVYNETEQVPEVIFLDLNMPVMDGWQFLEEFLRLPIQQKIRINILTSSIDALDYENWEKYKTRTHHTITYNSKPIRKKELETITRAA